MIDSGFCVNCRDWIYCVQPGRSLYRDPGSKDPWCARCILVRGAKELRCGDKSTLVRLNLGLPLQEKIKIRGLYPSKLWKELGLE